MNDSLFLEIFAKKLLVAEPKRLDIIAAVRQKIRQRGEAGRSLESPASLARSYNRQFLGFVSSPSKSALVGILTVLLLGGIFAHTFFEQWVWKLYAWIRFYHFAWWATYVVIEGVVRWTGIAIYFFLVLPVMARSIVRSSKPITFILSMLVPIYAILVGLYTVSKFTVNGRDRLENVLRDIGGTQPSILIAVTFLVFFPLALIVLGMFWRQRRLIKKNTTP